MAIVTIQGKPFDTKTGKAVAAPAAPAQSAQPATRYAPVGPTQSENVNTPGYVSAYKLDSSGRPVGETGPVQPGTVAASTDPLNAQFDRYKVGTSAYEQYVNSLPRDLSESDIAKIKKDTAAGMQGTVDAINQQYDLLTAQEHDAGLARLGSTRSINARSGTLTSDFGASNMAGTDKVNARAQQVLQNERMGKIATVLFGAQQMAQKEIDARRAEAQGNASTYQNMLKDKGEKMLGLVKDYAAAGGDVNKLKQSEPDIYKMFAEQYGGSELMLTAAVNSNSPAAVKRDYRYEVQGNNVVAYSVNPQTGQLEVQTEQVPGVGGGTATGQYDIKTSENGQLYFIPKNIDPSKSLDEQIIKYGAGGQFGGTPTKKTTNTPTTKTTTVSNYNTSVANLQAQGIPTGVVNNDGSLVKSYKTKLLDKGLGTDVVDWLWSAVSTGYSFEDIRAKIRTGTNGVPGDPVVLDTFVQTLQNASSSNTVPHFD